MKKMILALVVVFAMGNVAMAQEEQQKCGKKCDKTEMIKKRTEKMVKQYNLTDQQAAKLLKLNEEYADKLPAMRAMGGHKGPFGAGAQMKQDPCKQGGCASALKDFKTRPNKEGMMKNRQEMMKNREAYNKELKEIIGEEKYAQYEAGMKNCMQKGSQCIQGQKGQNGGCCGKCSMEKQAGKK